MSTSNEPKARKYRALKQRKRGTEKVLSPVYGGGVLPEGKRTGNSDPRSCLATASHRQFAHRFQMRTAGSMRSILQICGRRFKSVNHPCIRVRSPRTHSNQWGNSTSELTVQDFTCMDQFLTMAFAQLTYRESLRNIEVKLRMVARKWE